MTSKSKLLMAAAVAALATITTSPASASNLFTTATTVVYKFLYKSEAGFILRGMFTVDTVAQKTTAISIPAYFTKAMFPDPGIQPGTLPNGSTKYDDIFTNALPHLGPDGSAVRTKNGWIDLSANASMPAATEYSAEVVNGSLDVISRGTMSLPLIGGLKYRSPMSFQPEAFHRPFPNRPPGR
jgi:hypothetical protein